MYKDCGAKLPMLTRIMIGLSDIVPQLLVPVPRLVAAVVWSSSAS